MMTVATSSTAGRQLRWVLPVASIAIAVLAWEVLSRLGIVPVELSSPVSVAPWLWSVLQTEAFWSGLAHTLYHWAGGLLVATVLGIAVGLALGMNRITAKLLQVPMEFLRPIPPIVYLPLLLLLFGASDQVALGLAALGAFWPVLFQTFYGVQSLDPLTMETGRMFGLNTRQQIAYILVPGIAPSVATGIRIAATIALVITITIELVGGIPGLGADLRTYQLNGIYAGIYGLTIIMGVLGVLVNLGLELAERKVLAWHEPHRPRT